MAERDPRKKSERSGVDDIELALTHEQIAARKSILWVANGYSIAGVACLVLLTLVTIYLFATGGFCAGGVLPPAVIWPFAALLGGQWIARQYVSKTLAYYLGEPPRRRRRK